MIKAENQRFIDACNYLVEARHVRSLAEIAKMAGKTSQYFTDLKKEKANYSREILDLLNKQFGINIMWVISGEGEMLKAGTPQLSKAAHGHGIPLIPIDAVAGLPSIMTDSITQTDCDHYCVPDFTDKGVEYLIRVSGSSMYPKYANGDILGCVRVKDILFFQWGKVYVLDTSQGALVKRVFECKDDPTLITLVSDNKEHYPAFNIPKDDIRSLSLVAGVIRME